MCLRNNPIFVTSELSSQPIDLENNRLGQHKDFCTTLGWQEQNFKACSIGIESFGFWRKRGKNTKRVSFETKTKAFTRNDLLVFLAHLELVVDALSHRYGMDVIAVSHALACPIVQRNPLVCAGKIDWQIGKDAKVLKTPKLQWKFAQGIVHCFPALWKNAHCLNDCPYWPACVMSRIGPSAPWAASGFQLLRLDPLRLPESHRLRMQLCQTKWIVKMMASKLDPFRRSFSKPGNRVKWPPFQEVVKNLGHKSCRQNSQMLLLRGFQWSTLRAKCLEAWKLRLGGIGKVLGENTLD